jgi:hypothetical protein
MPRLGRQSAFSAALRPSPYTYEDPATKSYLEAFAKLEAGDPGAMAAFAAHVGRHADDQLASFLYQTRIENLSLLLTRDAGDVSFRREASASMPSAGRG